MAIDPQRFREQLVRGLSEDGLEELTLRLARKDHPDAHRTGRGRDGGIDVLSDYERPPARAWQAKTSTDGKADWSKCRQSLRAAMAGGAVPGHYTFAFSHPLSDRQRNFWRDHFVPEQRRAHANLDVLDYWDDLAWRIEPYPEMLEWLTDNALSPYIRSTLDRTGVTGVNPLANAVDLSEGLGGVADHAVEAGRDDPRFAYGETGREVDAGDAELADQRAHFSMSAGQRGALPSYTLSLRDGDRVQEVTARPRAGVEFTNPEPSFDAAPDGQLALAQARSSLAKGQAVSFTGAHVGLSGGDVPDRFRTWFTGSGSQTGTLELGVSDPLELTLTLADAGDVPETVPMHRVPSLPGGDMAYAGAIGGAVLAIDLVPAARPPSVRDDGGRWLEVSLTLTLAVHNEPARYALRGLGFARAFGAADRLRLACPGLLPADGLEIVGRQPIGLDEEETWEVAATVALALDGLTRRDGLDRYMPAHVDPPLLARAEIVLHLLQNGELSLTAEGEFRVPLPPRAKAGDAPDRWVSFADELPPILGRPTGLRVEQTVLNAEPLRVVETERGALALECRADDAPAAVVMRLLDRDSSPKQ